MNSKWSDPRLQENFSLVLGGPLYQLYLRSRLLKPPIELLERRVIASIVLTWLPLLILTLMAGSALAGVKLPFLFDLDVHIRLLLALPLLIGTEVVVHRRLSIAVDQFLVRGIIAMRAFTPLVLLMMLVLLPITFFVGALAHSKREGTREYVFPLDKLITGLLTKIF